MSFTVYSISGTDSSLISAARQKFRNPNIQQSRARTVAGHRHAHVTNGVILGVHSSCARAGFAQPVALSANETCSQYCILRERLAHLHNGAAEADLQKLRQHGRERGGPRDNQAHATSQAGADLAEDEAVQQRSRFACGKQSATRECKQERTHHSSLPRLSH